MTRYFPFSNFQLSNVKLEDGFTYRTVEHGYQAAKTLSELGRREIRTARTAADAKRLGRSVDLRPGWDSMKLGVMEDLLRQKFAPGTEFARALCEFTDPIVEYNYWHDQYWGDCDCPRHKNIPGQNQLGKLLTKLRTELLQGEKQ